jgi:hypothetical protein
MRTLLASLLLALLPAVPASAGTVTYEVTVEEWTETGASRFVSPALAHAERSALAAYGPFRVLDENTAALVGVTDEASPAAFQAMLRAHPAIATLAFIECPGTYDDRANLALGRMIRAAGLAAWVPDGGSVRSGAVELVLAGTTLTIDDGAEFAVHAWEDEDGYEASDYAADSPENRKYLAYYREMGMSAGVAAAFYAMTNSVPFEDARWLDGAEMRRWVTAGTDSASQAEPRLAYLDLGPALN